MSRAFILVVALLACLVLPPAAVAASSAGADERFKKAGAEYEAGRFEEAATVYEALLSDGFEDTRVYYNLGNARFKQSRLGPAILAYERALEIDPADADVAENLVYATQLIADKVGSPEKPFSAAILAALEKRFGADRATRAFLLLVSIAGLAALPLWFGPRPALRAALRVVVSIALPLGLIFLLITLVDVYQPGRAQYAVILADSVDGRSTPAADGTVLFTVHEGLKVEVRSERGGWINVTLPNGLTGWIESSRAGMV
jgi:tetratricopeptide (TPR) repeat protein